MSTQTKIDEAIQILTAVGMPRAQLNERSALCLLALLDCGPDSNWSGAKEPLIGITPIMDWSRNNYGKDYAPNTRETFRRQSMHQFVEAGLALYNPDDPLRPVNSPKAVYKVQPDFLALVRTFGTDAWEATLKEYLSKNTGLAEKYARDRELVKIPVHINEELILKLSSGDHSLLIKDIIEEFGPRFAPGSKLVYVGDTGNKYGFFDKELLVTLGIELDNHGKMPDVVLYREDKNWLFLIESVTSHGPVDGKRYSELQDLFKNSKAGLVFVTAMPTRSMMARFLHVMAWETEGWVSEAPSHLIHFNGDRFMGPYDK
ncbi:MAG: restriction endonuclease [Candidatus Doudnabacteria bacterium]|nr:restriction endonuclease [Candidatus Doudnabacteria bacterium]